MYEEHLISSSKETFITNKPNKGDINKEDLQNHKKQITQYMQKNEK